MGENIKITDETRAILEGYLAKQHARKAKRLAAKGKVEPFNILDPKGKTESETKNAEPGKKAIPTKSDYARLSSSLAQLVEEVRSKQTTTKNDIMVHQRLESVARYIETAKGLMESLID